MLPQKITITSNKSEISGKYTHRNFCPFKLLSDYFELRGGFLDEKEPFIIFKDGSLVMDYHARKLLKEILQSFGLNKKAI